MTSSYLVSVSCLGAAALTFIHITDWGNDALGKRHLHFSCTNIHAVLQLYEHPTPPFFCVTGKLFLFKSVVANILETDVDLPQVHRPFGGLSVLADIRGFIRWADIRGSDGGYPTRG